MPHLHRRAALLLTVCLAIPVGPACASPNRTAALAGAALDGQALPPSGAIKSAQGLKLIKDLGTDLAILDVRTVSEFVGGHIPGALNIPVMSLEDRLNEIPPDRPMLIVCHAGKRAAKAYETLSKTRPGMTKNGLWYLNATTDYKTDGTYVFKDK